MSAHSLATVRKEGQHGDPPIGGGSRVSGPAPAPESVKSIAPRRPRVLVIEDEHVIQRVLREVLQDEFDVTSAMSGKEAIEQLERSEPDVIVMDLRLPDIKGEDLLGRIRARGLWNHVPVLIATGEQDEALRITLLASGAQDFVPKPFSVSEIKARLRNLASAKMARDVLEQLVGQREKDITELARDVSNYQQQLVEALRVAEEARRVAEAASRVKTNFLRIMSHELKTPITAIQLHVRVLDREVEQKEAGRLSAGLERIVRSTKRLVQLVDTVLEWARIDGGAFTPQIEEVDWSKLVQGVVEELSGHARTKGVTLSFTSSATEPLYTDKRLARLVALNMTAHALQLTDSGVVEIQAQRRPDGHVLSVTSPALGLPEQGPEALLTPLVTLQDLQHLQGHGSGMGLGIVRDLATAIRGEIRFEGPVERGSTFLLVLAPLSTGDVGRART